MSRTAAANRVNELRRATLRDLADQPTAAAARALCAAHLDAPHEGLVAVEIRRLLVACRGIGRWHARKLLNQAKILDGGRLVGELQDRERHALGAALREPWPYETREPAPATT